MTVDPFALVREWHEKYGVPVRETVVVPEAERVFLRHTLIEEEAEEALEVLESLNVAPARTPFEAQVAMAMLAKELCDQIVVAIGTALEFGIDIAGAFVAVHESNMTKDGGERADGKITKGPSYVEPDLRPFVRPANVQR